MDWPIAGDILLDESAAAKRPRASGAAFRPRELQIWQGTHLKWPWGARTLRSIHCGRLLSRRRRKVDTVEVSKKPTPRLRLSSTAGGRGKAVSFRGFARMFLRRRWYLQRAHGRGTRACGKSETRAMPTRRRKDFTLKRWVGHQEDFIYRSRQMDLFVGTNRNSY